MPFFMLIIAACLPDPIICEIVVMNDKLEGIKPVDNRKFLGE